MTAETRYTLFLTKDLKERTPTEVFDCREKVYLYVIWEDIDTGVHTLVAFWFNPRGERQESTEYRFYVPEKGVKPDTWLWLKLHGGRGSKLAKSLDPQIGYTEFIGKWRVKLYLDDRYLTDRDFVILC